MQVRGRHCWKHARIGSDCCSAWWHMAAMHGDAQCAPCDRKPPFIGETPFSCGTPIVPEPTLNPSGLQVGWKHQDAVATLEERRKVKAAAYYQTKKKINALRLKASSEA